MTPTEHLAHDLLCLDAVLQRIAADVETATQRLRLLCQRITEYDDATMRMKITGEHLPPVEMPEEWKKP